MKAILNFLAVLILALTIATPIYFASNFAKVSGVKSESQYLIVSQIEKFPNITLSQNSNKYTLTYNKYAQSQAYIALLILNNPTSKNQTYDLEKITGDGTVFFGQDPQDRIQSLTMQPQSSVQISLISDESDSQTSTIEFIITTE